MRKFLRAVLPHVCIALHAVLVVAVILDVYNPMLGLLKGAAFLTLIALCFLSALAVSIALYADWRRSR